MGNWSGYQSLPFCLCAFVWWPSKASIAILASHRIGLLYKNTPASSLQGWSGARGVGAAGGDGGKLCMFVRNFPFATFLNFFPSAAQVADVTGARGHLRGWPLETPAKQMKSLHDHHHAVQTTREGHHWEIWLMQHNKIKLSHTCCHTCCK